MRFLIAGLTVLLSTQAAYCQLPKEAAESLGMDLKAAQSVFATFTSRASDNAKMAISLTALANTVPAEVVADFNYCMAKYTTTHQSAIDARTKAGKAIGVLSDWNVVVNIQLGLVIIAAPNAVADFWELYKTAKDRLADAQDALIEYSFLVDGERFWLELASMDTQIP